MKRINLITSLVLSLVLTGCSSFVEDITNLTEGSKYTVRHLREVTAEYDSDGNQTNFLKDGSGSFVLDGQGNCIPVYEEFETEEIKGSQNKATEAAAKSYEGFTALPFEQGTVLKDNSTEVIIKYNRVESTLTFDPDGGKWDFSSTKTDSSVKTFKRKFGSALPSGFDADLGKRFCSLTGWKAEDGETVSAIPQAFPAKNVNYKAQWTQTSGVAFKVRYMFENPECNGYEYDEAQDEIHYAEEGETTVVHLVSDGTENEVLAKNSFSNFEPSGTIDQQVVAADGSTVIEVKFNRKTIDVTLALGEGSWNYKQWKADKSVVLEVEDKVLTVKAGAVFNKSILSDAGKKSSGISKWQIDDGEDYVENLPDFYPLVSVKYTALWSNSAEASYYVEHWFEKEDCSDVSVETEVNYAKDENLTQKKSGLPETNTVAEAVVKAGFSAKEIKQQEIDLSGNTTVKIYYVRNSIDIKFNSDDGLWNYDLYKGGATPDTAVKIISGKFGTSVPYDKVNNFSKLKKIGKNLAGFSDGENTFEIDSLPQTFPDKGIEFTAVWTDKPQVSYTVIHMTEKKTSADDTDVTNYEEESRDTTKKGTPEYLTEASAKVIPGFEAKTVEQQEIAEDGSTEVCVYYKRLTYKVTFKANGGFWNYDKYKNNGETGDAEDKFVEGKFDTDIDTDSIDFAALKKTSHDFAGWTKDGGTKVFAADEVVKQYPASDVVYTAAWTEGTGIKYTVKHLFENVAGTQFIENEDLRQTGIGVKETQTEATPVTVSGFTLKAPVTQKEIKENESTVVEIEYTRNSYNFIFDAGEGTVSGNKTLSVSGKFEEAFDKNNTPVATRTNWTFGGWELNGVLVTDENKQLADQTYPAQDVTFTARWISTVNVSGLNTFGDITLNVLDDTSNSKYKFTVSLPETLKDKEWTYKWYVDTVYQSDTAAYEPSYETLKKGVHTITIKAVCKGMNFVGQKTVTVK